MRGLSTIFVLALSDVDEQEQDNMLQAIRRVQSWEDSKVDGNESVTAWHEDTNPVIGIDDEGYAIFHPAFLQAKQDRVASTHIVYPPKRGKRAHWLYNEVRMNETADVSFFNVNGHQYGYFGIQTVTEEPRSDRIICSIWDQLCTGDNEAECPEEKQVEVLECGEGVGCLRFGGEGTGAKSMLEFDGFHADTTFGFLTYIIEGKNDRMETGCYVHAAEFGGWKLISRMEANRAGKAAAIQGQYSFLEQWTEADFMEKRAAEFGPAFRASRLKSLGNTRSQIRRGVKFQHGLNETEDQSHLHGSTSNGRWTLASGGDYSKTKHDSKYKIVPKAKPQDPLLGFIDFKTRSSFPKGRVLTKAADPGIFLRPDSDSGCYVVTPQGDLSVESNGEYCEEFELTASGEELLSRKSGLCITQAGLSVGLEKCKDGAAEDAPGQKWGEKEVGNAKKFCRGKFCLERTGTRVRLEQHGGGCPAQSGPPSDGSCWWNYRHVGPAQKTIEIRVESGEARCLDWYGTEWGLQPCHGGQPQQFHRFGDKLCIPGFTSEELCVQIVPQQVVVDS